MSNIWCKLFGHKIVGLNTKRHFAHCERCQKGLKVSYDISYGQTLIIGEYGNQTTFIWCECGNELCSSNSHTGSGDINIQSGMEFYKCSQCGDESRWMFDSPVPFKLN